jgi:hypothetical protein
VNPLRRLLHGLGQLPDDLPASLSAEGMVYLEAGDLVDREVGEVAQHQDGPLTAG